MTTTTGAMMHESRTALLDDFHQAGGRREDRRWAALAGFGLDELQVAPQEVDAALASALALVHASGEGAEELFGAPDVWADEQLRRIQQDGGSFRESTRPGSNPLTQALAMAALLCTGEFTRAALRGQWHTERHAGEILVPLGIGLLVAYCRLLVPRLTARMRRSLVLVVWALVVGGGIAGLLCLAFQTPLLGLLSIWWMFAAAVVHALGAWLAYRHLPGSAPRLVPGTAGSEPSDAQWLARAASALRARDDLTEHQVRERLDEATAHAQAAHRTLWEEFGNPIGYARTVPGDRAVELRLYALLCLGLSLFCLLQGWARGGILAWTICGILGALLAASAVALWRERTRISKEGAR